MSEQSRCLVCGGPLVRGYDADASCLHCGRSPEPERVSLAEALIGSAIPLKADGDGHRERQRQQVPLSVSLDRADRWMRGEKA